MKQHDKLYKSILFILQLALREEGNGVPYTSLVKYLYLLDCFYAEENNGKQYTDIEWRFLNFGPYSSSIEDILSMESTDSNFSVKKLTNKNSEENASILRYTGWKQDNILTDLSNNVISKLTSKIKEYSKLSVNEFLHFIYFETTPMIEAKHREKLNFSKCKKINFSETYKPIPEKILTTEELTNIKSLLNSIELDFSSEEDDSVWYDPLYFSSLQNAKPIFESDEDITTNLLPSSGIAKIYNNDRTNCKR